MENNFLRYKVETKHATLQGKRITLTSRTPIFTPEQREKRRREIETRLYDVVSAYRKNA